MKQTGDRTMKNMPIPLELQIPLDGGANHRALRRCHGCGAYARPFDFDRATGVVLCERCAARSRRPRQREAEPEPDESMIDFRV
jgi:hypothetical protein